MTLRTRHRIPLLASASVVVAATGFGLFGHAPVAEARDPAANKALVEASFAAWSSGTGSPFALLADDASWTIEGNSVAAGTYLTKEAFMREVIGPFNARMQAGIKPAVRSITAEDDRVVVLFDASGTARDGRPYANSYAWFFQMRDGRVETAHAFFDAARFDALWNRVQPAD